MKKLLLLVLAVVGLYPCTQIAAMEHSTTQNIPNNQIWYTSSDGNVVTPSSPYVFGATITSNTYSNGKGVITFDGNVTMIGELAFYNCSSLTSTTIPDGVTTIGDRAFWGCSSLTSVTIPDSVTTIGDWAFRCCRSLTSVTIPDSVTTIGDEAFSSCYILTSVTIGDSVTTIGRYAFCPCPNLTSVTIGNSVTTIGDGAFTGCNSLVQFNGKFAEDNGRILVVDGTLVAFAPAGLTRYIVPNSVTTIGKFAFYNCSSLTNVTVPDSVTTIGAGAFYGCNNLAKFKGKLSKDNGRILVVDGTLVAFAPAGLTRYIVPNSVTTIGDKAFWGCDNLTSVTIGKGVSVIGEDAFQGCNIDTIVCCAKIPPKLDDSFDKFENLIVPTGCEEAYANSDWGKYLE